MSRTSSASCRWPIGHRPSSARAKPGSGRQTASVVLTRQDVHSFGADDSFCDSTPYHRNLRAFYSPTNSYTIFDKGCPGMCQGSFGEVWGIRSSITEEEAECER